MLEGSWTMFLDMTMTTTTKTTRRTAINRPLPAGNPNKRINQYPAARSAALEGLQLSSVLTSTTNQSTNILESFRISSRRIASPRSNSLLSLGKTVGIIGGASVLSTLVFLEKIMRWSSRNGEEAIPFVVCSDPKLNRELESLTTLRRRSSSFSDSNCIGMIDDLRGKLSFLEKAGAGCIVMPCHSSHIWHEQLSEGCKVPFLHAGECVSRELKRAKMRPLEAGSNVKIGILGTDPILMATAYQENLEREGFETVLPDKAAMEHLVVPAVEAFQRKDIEGARNLLRIAIQVLLIQAVNVVILASNEIQGLLPRDEPLLKKCIDPMDSLARSAIDWAKSKEKLLEVTET